MKKIKNQNLKVHLIKKEIINQNKPIRKVYPIVKKSVKIKLNRRIIKEKELKLM